MSSFRPIAPEGSGRRGRSNADRGVEPALYNPSLVEETRAPIVSREQLHRAVEDLPEHRLGAAAELLEALARHDERVSVWRESLSAADLSEIASSLRQVHVSGEWIAEAVN